MIVIKVICIIKIDELSFQLLSVNQQENLQSIAEKQLTSDNWNNMQSIMKLIYNKHFIYHTFVWKISTKYWF